MARFPVRLWRLRNRVATCRQFSDRRRDYQRPLHVPHDGAELGSWRYPSQGNAGDSDNAGRSGDLDDGVIRRNPQAQRPLLDGTLKFVARGVKKDGADIGDVSITEEEGETVPSHRRRKIIQCLLRIGRAARQPGSPRQSGRRRRSRERVSWRRRSGESRLTATTSPQLLLELMAI
jgi:hypothetical protein